MNGEALSVGQLRKVILFWFFSLLGTVMGGGTAGAGEDINLNILSAAVSTVSDSAFREAVQGWKLLGGFLYRYNPEIGRERANRMGRLYLQEAAREGVNPELAFVQMCLETGYLRYGGQVSPEQNNFCGLGALDSGEAGAVFSSERAGVRAHIQHLKAYASTEPLQASPLDPRHHLVPRGSAATAEDLAGSWATDPEYGKKLERLLRRLRRYKAEQSR